MGNHDDDSTPIVQEIIGLDQDGVLVSFEHEDEHYSYSDTFPLLRPMSDLIMVIEHNGRRFIPMHRLKNGGTDLNEYRFLEWKGYSAIDNEEHETCYNPDNRSFNQYFMGDTRECRDQCSKFQNLFEWHFDVFGLIEKGLAIDINKLESEVK
ncbi:hypothetical protein [Sphingobacterium sp. JUb56]|uniref:hypothetical protein n=1 Tax=Sphingobacterium sp. JUb56 TaxID=2587145 RepID=UPI00160ADC0B|nr:hypothetical protein [Sphingobacterium sp. JUb56]MBB2951992.1 hypothetical protein [Sphingobacterium sp. JUb56]